MATAVQLDQHQRRRVRADLPNVSNDKARRGASLRDRRLKHGLSVLALSNDSGVARATIDKAEAGTASEDSVSRLEEFFDQLDETTGLDTSAQEHVPPQVHGETIEFDITGPRTDWHVVVRGPADQADDMRRQVVELLRDMEPKPAPE